MTSGRNEDSSPVYCCSNILFGFIGCFHSMSFLVHVLSSLAVLDLLPTGHTHITMQTNKWHQDFLRILLSELQVLWRRTWSSVLHIECFE